MAQDANAGVDAGVDAGAKEMVKLQIPFRVLAELVAGLSAEDKRRLWELLEEEMALAEEMLWEQAPEAQEEIREARSAYRSGDFVTIDEYISGRQDKPR